MFNSNIPAASLLSIDSSSFGLGGHTPKTPEIVNSLIAMTNPLDSFNYGAGVAAAVSAAVASVSAASVASSASCSAASTPGVTVRNFNGHPNGQVSCLPKQPSGRILNLRIRDFFFVRCSRTRRTAVIPVAPDRRSTRQRARPPPQVCNR